jgi:16S rRNA (cytidine1402-2'-O)-methyltransferase
MSQLYVVATPIGNLEDVSLRALRVLREVPLIAAEDTRTARILLYHYGIKNRLLSYTDHNMARRIPEILRHLESADAALVSDAGTPAVSDPGAELVASARAAGHEVSPVPGASAVVAALSASGLSTRSFCFAGFLPRGEGDLRRLLKQHAGAAAALVAFEAPARLRRSLTVIAGEAPAARLAVCRELTKLHEELFIGTAGEALAHFTQPRGEFVLVLEPVAAPADDEGALHEEVALMKRLGLSRAQATALLGPRYGVSRRKLYEAWLNADARATAGDA